MRLDLKNNTIFSVSVYSQVLLVFLFRPQDNMYPINGR